MFQQLRFQRRQRACCRVAIGLLPLIAIAQGCDSAASGRPRMAAPDGSSDGALTLDPCHVRRSLRLRLELGQHMPVRCCGVPLLHRRAVRGNRRFDCGRDDGPRGLLRGLGSHRGRERVLRGILLYVHCRVGRRRMGPPAVARSRVSRV